MFNILILFLIIPLANLCSGGLDFEESYARPHFEDSTSTYGGYFTAQFLKPFTSNVDYAAQAVPLPLASPHWKLYDVHPGTDFGFEIGFRGLYNKSNITTVVSWQHFSSSDSASKKVSSEDMIGPLFEIGPDAEPYKKAHGNSHIHFDEVKLDFGKLIEISEDFKADLFAGVCITKIKQNLCSLFSNPDGTVVRTINTPIRFSGAGPHMGIHFNYHVFKGLHFMGTSEFSLLVGSAKDNTLFTATSPALKKLGIPPPNKQSIHVNNRTQVVPAFEEKLGFGYCINLWDCALFTIEAGYQAQIYLNALQSIHIGSEVVTPPILPDTIGVYARTFQRIISNFALTGPYLTIQIEY
jgi:hypothetical protein